MKTFVIVDVYVMLFTLYTTTLDVSTSLELLQPTRRQLGSEDPPTVMRPPDELQPATREA